jgi:hypothetical protein
MERTRRGKVRVGGRKKIWKKREQAKIKEDRRRNEKESYREGGRQYGRKEN